MRLLKSEGDGGFSLAEFYGDSIPPYAILSHTWGTDNEEVTFQDMVDSVEESKDAGYRKILFCAKQAAEDDLEYFWIDTCCINKSSSAELAEAINSMFRWYREAAKCYVYLSDISTSHSRGDPSLQQEWKPAFRHSRWFTRGWTLQELLAPESIDFFSMEGERLGSRFELLQDIHEITGIPIQALQRNPLSEFSIDDRMSWAASRTTKREEDAAYCLLGLFDIHMPLIYGEGRQKALSRLLKEIGESINHGSPVSPSTLSTVPFVRNSDFVDRPDILARIGKKWRNSRVALVGVGGVGKSQIAIEYAYSISNSINTLILWVYAGSKAALEQSYRDIADANRIPGRDQPEVDILGLVKRWLQHECGRPWVMMLDNVDDQNMAEHVDNFIPQNGLVLVTSRSEDAAAYLVGGHTNIINVGPMAKEQALELLRKTLRGEIVWDDGKASDLVKALDYIPLAISQAASFLNHKVPKYTLARYLNEIKGEGEKDGFLEQAYPDRWRSLSGFEQANSVVLTWHKSFRCIQAERPSAAALLSLLSFFDRQEIPEHLVYISGVRSYQFTFHRWWPSNQNVYTLPIVIAGAIAAVACLVIRLSIFTSLLALLGTPCILLVLSYDSEEHSQGNFDALKSIVQQLYSERTIDKADIDEDIILLRKYAFLSQNLKSNCYQMHRLVQLSVRKWLESKSRFTQTKEESLLALLEAFPMPDQEDWIKSKSLIPHAEAVMSFAPFRTAHLLHYAILSNITAYYTSAWKGHQALHETVDAATKRTQNLFDPKNVLALKCGFTLSWLLMADGQYDEAAKWAKRVLRGREMVCGSNSSDTLSAYSSLGLMLRCQGKYKEAEQMSRKARDGFKEAFGAGHPFTRSSSDILGTALYFGGKYAEAEQLELEGMKARKKILGNEHPETLKSKHNLATTLRGQGKYAEAERMNRETLALRKKVLGKEHPDTLKTMNTLAESLSRQGKYAEAEKMGWEALVLREKVLGKEHPKTLLSMSNIARALRNQGKYAEAEKMDRETLELREKVLGKEHPDTLQSMNNIALALQCQGKYAEAEKLDRDTIVLRKKVLGKEHPDTLMTMSNLAATLRNQGKYAEAERISQEALELCESVLGKEHPDTLMSMCNVSGALYSQGKYEEVEKIDRQTLALREKVLGKEHPHTLQSMSNLAIALRNQGKYAEAEKMDRETLELREKVLGKEHLDTLQSMNSVSGALHVQGKYAEAEGMDRKTLALRKKLLGKEHPDTLISMNNVALALQCQGQYAEAEKMDRETLELRKKVLGKEHPDILISMRNLAATLRNQEKYTEAERISQEALELCESVFGKEHPDTLMIMGNISGALYSQGKYEEVERIDRQALALYEKVLGKEHPHTLQSLSNLAVALRDQGKYSEAEGMDRETLELRRNVLGEDHPDTLASMNNLAVVLNDQGNYVEAEKMNRETLVLRKKVLGRGHPQTLQSMDNLAATLHDQKKYAEAEYMNGEIQALRNEVQ